MNTLKDLYVVKTPFQLLSATEANHKFKNANNELILLLEGENKNQDQMYNLLNKEIWNDVKIIKYNGLISLLQISFFIRKIKKQKYRNIFIGEYRSINTMLFAFNLNHEQTFLLDDGSVTIQIQQEYINKRYPWLEIKNYKTIVFFLIIKYLFGLKIKSNKIINLYTCFKLKAHSRQKIIMNDFAYTKKLVNLKCKRKINKTYFLGNRLSELNVLSEEYHIWLLKKIKCYYKDFIYIPHRKESKRLLKLFKDNIDIQIEEIDNMIEFELIDKGIIPYCVAGFYSTALYTIHCIYPSVRIDSILLDMNQVYHEHRDRIDIIYQNYSKIENFNFIDLNVV